MEDREMVRRIQNGQKEYLNEIAGKYYDDIYYFCCYQTGSREDAYDLAQETFLRFIRYVEHYRYHNLKGYLLTIAMNLCRDYIRKLGKVCTARENVETAEAMRAAGRSEAMRPMDTAQPETGIALAESLRRLPDAQREAVLLHHFYGYKNREIARMTGVSCAAVKSRVNQGLKKLRQLLDWEDFCG